MIRRGLHADARARECEKLFFGVGGTIFGEVLIGDLGALLLVLGVMRGVSGGLLRNYCGNLGR